MKWFSFIEQREQTSELIEEMPRFSLRTSVGRLLKMRELGLLAAVVIFGTIIAVVNPVFLSFENLVNVFRASVFIFIVGCALTFVFVGGELDLSVGSVLGLTGVVTALAMLRGIPVPLGILVGLSLGAGIGLINGFLVTRFRIPALIVTLGMLYAARGTIIVATGGEPVYPLPESFKIIAQGSLLGIPNLIPIAAVIGALSHFVLTYAKFGYTVRAVGGNMEAARVCGIDVNRIRLWLYVLSGTASALAGILMASRLSSGQPNQGVGFELQAISAVIIGGTSLFGGIGSIFGSLLGSLILSMLANGMVLMHISAYWQNIVVGAVIVAAVGFDQYRRTRMWQV